MKELASLLVLSYHRQSYLQRSLESLWVNTTAPYELIVLDDGSHDGTEDYILSLVKEKKISTALLNVGWNRGIGTAVNRGVDLARGDILFKLDADLLYFPGWLEESCRLLRTFPQIGCLGLFRYHHPPCKHEDEFIKTHEGGFDEVKDFVGSAVGFRREIYEKFGPWTEEGWMFSEDCKYKQAVQAGGYMLVLPQHDLVENVGFGEQHSSLIKTIDWEGGKHTYNVPNTSPLIFGLPT